MLSCICFGRNWPGRFGIACIAVSRRRLSQLRRSAWSTRCLNFRERAAQLNRQPPKQIAAVCSVTGLARPLERRSRGSNPPGADRQCGSVQLMRCSCQGRQVAAPRSVFNLPLGLNCCLLEFLQQLIQRVTVVGQPSRKYVPVNCGAGIRLIG